MKNTENTAGIQPIRTPINHRIDFVTIISVDGANPNGDPLGDNMPRTDLMGRGEISAVCIKHKLRNRLDAFFRDHGMECDEILITAADTPDRKATIEGRIDAKNDGAVMKLVKDKSVPNVDKAMEMCNSFRDVRTFGYVLPIPGISLGIRGPVSMTDAKSIKPISPIRQQITKCISTSASGNKSEGEKGSDTMGNRYKVDGAVYVLKGSISAELAQRTGFSEEDAEALKNAIMTMFDGDESAARPAGSMAVEELYWFVHNSKLGQYPVKTVHNSVQVTPTNTAPFFKSEFNKTDIPELTVEVLHPSSN